MTRESSQTLLGKIKDFLDSIISNNKVQAEIDSSALPDGASTEEKQDDMIEAIRYSIQQGATGVATGGSTTTLEDEDIAFENDELFKNAKIVIERGDGGTHYVAEISSHATAGGKTTYTFPDIGVTVQAGDRYWIRVPVEIQDIERIGGTTQTGDDWTKRFEALNDETVKGLLKTLGDIDTGDNIITRLGALASAAETDPTASADQIALLKGIIRQLQGDGDKANSVQLTDALETLQNSTAQNQDGTELETPGYGTVAFDVDVTGDFDGLVNFEGSIDGTNWRDLWCLRKQDMTLQVQTNGPGVFVADARGFAKVRARVSDYVAGSVTVVARATQQSASDSLFVAGGEINIVDQPINTQLTGSNVLYDGTKSIGSTAEELGSDQDVLELMIQADPDNTEDIFVGNATSQSVKLKPGQSYEMSMANLNLVYVKADSGTQTVNYHARGES